jgi:hypothetical protein
MSRSDLRTNLDAFTVVGLSLPAQGEGAGHDWMGPGLRSEGVHIFMAKVDSAHEIRESCSRTRPGGGGEGVLLAVDFVGGEGDEGVHATEIVVGTCSQSQGGQQEWTVMTTGLRAGRQ